MIYIYGADSTNFNFYFLPALIILCKSKLHKIDLNSLKIHSEQAWSQRSLVYQRNVNLKSKCFTQFSDKQPDSRNQRRSLVEMKRWIFCKRTKDIITSRNNRSLPCAVKMNISQHPTAVEDWKTIIMWIMHFSNSKTSSSPIFKPKYWFESQNRQLTTIRTVAHTATYLPIIFLWFSKGWQYNRQINTAASVRIANLQRNDYLTQVL